MSSASTRSASATLGIAERHLLAEQWNTEYFDCHDCGRRLRKEWTDEEALEEYRQRQPDDGKPRILITVCQPCHNSRMGGAL